jgi:hypothetical protein
MKIEILEWRECKHNTLQGFAKIRVDEWELCLDGVAIHTKEGKSWASLPSRPQLDRDGAAMRGDDGKVRYFPILEFDDKAASFKFSDAVIEAVAKHNGTESKRPAAGNDRPKAEKVRRAFGVRLEEFN